MRPRPGGAPTQTERPTERHLHERDPGASRGSVSRWCASRRPAFPVRPPVPAGCRRTGWRAVAPVGHQLRASPPDRREHLVDRLGRATLQLRSAPGADLRGDRTRVAVLAQRGEQQQVGDLGACLGLVADVALGVGDRGAEPVGDLVGGAGERDRCVEPVAERGPGDTGSAQQLLGGGVLPPWLERGAGRGAWWLV